VTVLLPPGLAIATLLIDGGEALDVNDAWSQLAGQSRDASLGTGWLDAVDPSDRTWARTVVAGGRSPAAAQWRLRCRPHAEHWVEAHVGPRVLGAQPSARLVSVVDISEHKALERSLLDRATHDDLTGALTRAALVERVELALLRLRRRPTALTLLFVDLDAFKQVNDHFGHDAGDRALVTAANRLHAVLRPDDALGRVGGDEFVVLCEDLAHWSEAIAIALRVLASLAQPYLVRGDGRAGLQASVGVAFPGAGGTADRLFRQADQAMYAAKALGGNRYHVFGDGDALSAGASDAELAWARAVHPSRSNAPPLRTVSLLGEG
jgi:diguanylate cyclase (GGDEF)-like protein/PAS domain S-box-containing protein